MGDAGRGWLAYACPACLVACRLLAWTVHAHTHILSYAHMHPSPLT